MKKLIYFLILSCLLFGANTTKIDIQSNVGYDVGTNHLCSYYYRANNLLTDLNSSSMDDGFGSETINFDLCNELKKTGVQFLYWPIDYGKPMDIVNVGCDDCLPWLESKIDTSAKRRFSFRNQMVFAESLGVDLYMGADISDNPYDNVSPFDGEVLSIERESGTYYYYQVEADIINRYMKTGITCGNTLAVFCENCTVINMPCRESLLTNCHSFVTLKNNEKTLQNILKGLCL